MIKLGSHKPVEIPAQQQVGAQPVVQAPVAPATAAVTTPAPTTPDPAAQKQFGFARYGGSLKVGGTPLATPASMADGVQHVRDLAGLAVEYARAGKHRIARDVIRDARESLGALSAAAGGVELHPGKFGSSVGQATRALDKAVRTVDSLAELKPVGEGRADVKKTVLLFGLSANPPTGMGGHAGIVAWGGQDLRVDLPNDEKPAEARERVGIDEVWVLPVYKHAFASKSNLLPFEHREAMAKLAFEDMPGLEGRVQVKDTEKQVIEGAFAQAAKEGRDPSTVRVGTIDMVRKLMNDHPDTQFVLALGGDTFADLRGGKWKEGDTLQQLVPIVVLPRAGVDGVAGTEENAPKLTDISSTKVRASKDEAFLGEALNPKVLEYIKANKLYAFGES